MIQSGDARRLYHALKPSPIYCTRMKICHFPRSTKVNKLTLCTRMFSQLPPRNSDSPAPCKIFPKTPKIALTIDDVPQSEYQRRKSSGSSVNSNHSAVEPHVYDFQECEKNVESSFIIRFVQSALSQFHFD